jgi:hypothetical protein
MTDRRSAIELGTKALALLNEADRVLAEAEQLAPTRHGGMGLEQPSDFEGQIEIVTSSLAGWLGQLEHFAVDTDPHETAELDSSATIAAGGAAPS